jgi:esterase/lipase superfamily enzyme
VVHDPESEAGGTRENGHVRCACPDRIRVARCADSGQPDERLKTAFTSGLGLGGRPWRRLRALPGKGAARRSRVGVLCAIGLAAIAAGCSSRPYGTLVVGSSAPDAGHVDLLVATTRAPVLEPPGVMFGGSRGRGLDYADIVVSIPPASARQAGDVTLASSPPGNAEHDFVVLRADRMDLAQAKANFDARIKRTPGRRVLIFVHGFNTRFEEAVYRFAQIVYDARVDVAPVLFTWPSGGNVTDYVYDRDSAIYSRDAFEAVLQALVKDPNVDSISILAHSMGNYLAIESLRQMSIRDRGLSPKIRDVMLASPDIDVDVFRRQIAEIDAGPRPAQFTLFISRDDRALGLSSFLARDSTRLGALDPNKEPYRSILEKGRVQVIDLTSVASNDITNHGKFASGEVVGAIGERLAEGQSLTDAKAGLVESLGTFTSGAINVAAGVATGAVAAPTKILDPARTEKSVDTAAQATTLAQ